MKDITIRVSDEDSALLMRAAEEGAALSLIVSGRRIQATLPPVIKEASQLREGLREDGALFVG